MLFSPKHFKSDLDSLNNSHTLKGDKSLDVEYAACTLDSRFMSVKPPTALSRKAASRSIPLRLSATRGLLSFPPTKVKYGLSLLPVLLLRYKIKCISQKVNIYLGKVFFQMLNQLKSQAHLL